MVTDLAQGSVPALLPFLRSELHLSYTRTAAIMLAATIASSVVQPIFGHLFDTRRGEWLLVAGPAVAGPRHRRAGLRAHLRGRASLCVLASAASASRRSIRRRASTRPGSRASGARPRCRCSRSGGNLGVALGPAARGTDRDRSSGSAASGCSRSRASRSASPQLAGLAALGGATAHARVAHARYAGRDRWGAMGAAARGAHRARLRALRPAHVHPAARARRAPQQPRLRLARARADALRGRPRHAGGRPAGRPLRPHARCSR